jgi:hypothetical protein
MPGQVRHAVGIEVHCLSRTSIGALEPAASALDVVAVIAGIADTQRVQERRNISRRGAIVKQLAEAVAESTTIELTVRTVELWFGIPEDGARRLLQQLCAAGLMRETNRGIWVRAADGSAKHGTRTTAGIARLPRS